MRPFAPSMRAEVGNDGVGDAASVGCASPPIIDAATSPAVVIPVVLMKSRRLRSFSFCFLLITALLSECLFEFKPCSVERDATPCARRFVGLDRGDGRHITVERRR